MDRIGRQLRRAHEDGWVREGSWKRKLLDYDPLTKCRTDYYFHEGKMQQRLVETYDVNEIIEYNKASVAMTDERARFHERGYIAATVPIAFVPDILKKTSMGRDRKAVSRWLKDPAHKDFLRRNIRVGV